MQKSWSYIKDSSDFLNKTKTLSCIPDSAILVAVNVVGLYPIIPHEASLKTLREASKKEDKKSICLEFVLKNNFFYFDSKSEQQVLGRVIYIKFPPPYACLFMRKFDTSFLETQKLQPLVWLRYIDDIFFVWSHSEDKPNMFLHLIPVLSLRMSLMKDVSRFLIYIIFVCSSILH